MKYKPGQSGNIKGRPKGAKSKKTLIRESLEQMLLESGDELVLKTLEMAKDGNRFLLEFVVDRVLPAKSIEPNFPKLDIKGDLLEQHRMLLDHAYDGLINASHLKSISQALTDHAKIMETKELAERIEKLENSMMSK